MTTNTWWDDDPAEMYWMEITDRSDLGGELWAPKANAVGEDEATYTLVSFVQPGDRVFHWPKSERAIVGWSEAAGPLGSDIRSWQARGTAGRTRGEPTEGPTWVMPLKGFHRLDAPITREALNGPLYADVLQLLEQTKKVAAGPAYAPFQHYGGRELRAHQGYLTKFPAALVSLLFPNEEAEAGGTRTASTPRRTRGQAFVADAVRRSAIEKHAVRAVWQHYESLGATDIVELGQPYDLRMMLGGIERHVEVKGSTIPDVETVLVTQGEVDHVHAWAATDLVIVDGIELTEVDGRVETSGGTLRVFGDWAPQDRHLKPTHLRYTLPG